VNRSPHLSQLSGTCLCDGWELCHPPPVRRLPLAAVTAAALCLISMVLAPSANADPGHGRAVGHRVARVCNAPAPGEAACDSYRRDAVDSAGNVVPDASSVPANSLKPADIKSAYNLAATSGGGRTVAIVDAYDDPYAERDLGVYRQQFGLGACTTANGCFKKVSQTGSTRSLPRANASWGQEISLDLDMVSAACPGCKILLVEATSPSFANLATAVRYALGQPGVIAVSNSYGGSDNTGYATYFNKSGVAITASSGDNGYGVEAPASYPNVVAVGGTSLRPDTNTTRGWTETAWQDAGSGCSTLNSPAWTQTGTGCAKKATADVSAVADPATGVAVYDTYGSSGWLVFGGTSVASPIIASVYALANDFGTSAGAYTWAHTSSLNDVTTGFNGSCGGSSLCTAGAGWDGPTGLGTPNGLGAF
jgi:hypothetical protein